MRRWRKKGRQGKPSRQAELRLFFGNVTSLSKTVLAYMKSARSKYQILCLAEHKKAREDIPATQKKMVDMGLKSWWTQARKTPDGVSGGTSIHLQRCFKAHRIDWPDLPAGQLLHEDPDMWTGIQIQALANFVIVTAYFKDGIGMTGQNLGMLSKILAWVRAVGLPWLIVADWNTTPQLLAQSGALHGIDSKIIIPANCEATCSSGIGRILDYVVASAHMAKLIEVRLELEAPTKPHVGLEVSINMELLNDKVRVLQAPTIPQVVPIRKVQHRSAMDIAKDPKFEEKKRKLPRKGAWVAQTELRMKDNCDCEGESDEELSWEDARIKAREWTTGRNRNKALADKSSLTKSAAFKLNAKGAILLGKTYGNLITTAEFYLSSRDPLLRDKPGLAIGRAKGPKSRWRELKEELGCTGKVEENSACKETRAWATIAGKLRLWSKLRPQNSEQAKNQSDAILKLVQVNVHNLAKWADESKDMHKIRRAEEWQKHVKAWHKINDRQLELLCQSSTDLHASHARNAAYRSSKEFVLWQLKEAETNHSKGIYRWIKQAGAEAEWVDYIHKGKIMENNEEACEARAGTWEGLWGNVHEEHALHELHLAEAWQEVKEARAKEKLKDMTIEQLHEALFTFPRDTGKGSDNASPDFVKALPKAAKEEIVSLFNSILRSGTWPWQWLHVLIALLPKPQGGERPIGLLPFFMRLFFRMQRDETRSWAEGAQGEWDTAVRNSSALRAALLRSLQIETAISEQEAFALILLDIEKFYDSIPITSLLREGLRLGYSPGLLSPNATICLAYRTLKTRNGASREIQPKRSIVAGLGEANNLAKIVLHGLCEEYTVANKQVKLSTFVDDTAQFTRGEPQAVAMAAGRSGRDLVARLRKAGYVISPKSVMLSNCKRTQHIVKSALQGINVNIKNVSKAADLGLDQTADGKRGDAKRRARVAKASAKDKRIARIHGSARRAHRSKTIMLTQKFMARKRLP